MGDVIKAIDIEMDVYNKVLNEKHALAEENIARMEAEVAVEMPDEL